MTKARLKILVVDTAGRLWGSERALLDMMDSASSVDFAVCCPLGSLLALELEKRGVPCFPWIEADLHLKSRWRRFISACGIFRACREARPDVIHLNQAGGYRITRLAAALLGVTVIAHVRIFEDAAYLASCEPKQRTLRGIIGISEAITSEIKKYPALSEIPVHCIYDAYVPNFSWNHYRGARHDRRIVCLGRVASVKGQETLIAAARLLKNEIVVIGDGDSGFVQKLKDEAPNNVCFTGYKQEISAVLDGFAVLVCPSTREPLGRVILEAWDAGLVPVAFAGSGGAAEIISASGGGILYSEQTASSLAEALRTAIKLEPERRHLLVSKGRKWMLRETSPVVAGERIGEVLRSAVR